MDGAMPTGTRLDDIVSRYIETYRRAARDELESFSDEPSDQNAVERAALAELPNGNRHPHQRRIPRAALDESGQRLLDNLPMLREARTFDELLELVSEIIRPIPCIGELAAYDTALRIGARFGLAPERVYLHAGTREGARALGFDRAREAIEVRELPVALRELSARELEDLLCIYKDELAGVSAGEPETFRDQPNGAPRGSHPSRVGCLVDDE
jgi:hypothetical protein